MTDHPLAVVTGASSGIGKELARVCARHNHDLIIAADEAEIDEVAEELDLVTDTVIPVQADLGANEGVDALWRAIAGTGRPVDALFANAGRGAGRGFLDQDFADSRAVVATNVIGTLDLVHRVARTMRDRGAGRILITGSVVGYVPGPYMSVYNASKAFVNSFTHALREELEDSGVSVTCLMPGLTDTRFFERARMSDTRLWRMDKDDPAMVAEKGFEALMKGEDAVATGTPAKIQTLFSGFMSERIKARLYQPLSRPGGR